MGPFEPITAEQIYFCAFCQGPGGTKHHLIPRHIGKRFGAAWGYGKTIRLCRSCHDDVHYYFSHWELAESFNTEAKLREELKNRKQ